MDRRNLIKTFGALAGSLSYLPFAGFASATANVPERPGPQMVKRIATSIQASFGQEFRVISSETDMKMTTSLIKHQGNVYQVTSTDLVEWRIIKSTDM